MISTKDLIKKVRFLINETEDDAAVSLITDDIRSIDDTVKELLPQAVSIVQRQCNGKYVNVKSLLHEGIDFVDTSDGFKAIVVPCDFASLVSMKLKSWKQPCFEVTLSDSAEALCKFAKNSFLVSRRPACVEDVATNGEKILKLFPAESTDQLVHFVYEAHFDVAEGLNMSDSRMVDAVSYVCTALLYNVFERHDAAKSFMSFATVLCGDNNGK